MGEKLVKFSVRNLPEILEKWMYAINSEEGQTNLKTVMFSLFSANFFLFIAAPPSRGADHGVGSNSIPTLSMLKYKIRSARLKKLAI